MSLSSIRQKDQSFFSWIGFGVGSAKTKKAGSESLSSDHAPEAFTPHDSLLGGTSSADSQPARSVPLAIQEAITARHVLRIDYRDRGDRVTVREVEPVVFAATRAQWYLLGWCRLRDAGRAFRLDRILAAADTGEPAPHRSYADLRVDIPDAIVRQPELSG